MLTCCLQLPACTMVKSCLVKTGLALSNHMQCSRVHTVHQNMRRMLSIVPWFTNPIIRTVRPSLSESVLAAVAGAEELRSSAEPTAPFIMSLRAIVDPRFVSNKIQNVFKR